MVWNFPDISLEEMVKLIQGFVDILILASSYQSSGLLAHWDAHNIKRAFQWASFFENVLGKLISLDVYKDSVGELDAAIYEMTCNPSFPKGLANLSCNTLVKARNLVLEHFFHTLPLRDSHLMVFLTAIIEMDLEKLSGSEHDYLPIYLNKLTMNAPFHLVPEKRGHIEDSVIISKTMETGTCPDDDLTKFTLQELLRRQSAVSGILTIGTGLDILSNAFRCSNCTDFQSSSYEEELKPERTPVSAGTIDQLANFSTWNRWKSSTISYFLHAKTARLVSGANMIFSAPKLYWVQVFERLNTSAKCRENNLHETMEILLFGRVTSKWNCLIEYFMSISYDPFTVSKLYLEVCNLLSGRPLSFHSREDSTYAKESDILEYLVKLLDGQVHQLWKLPPVLLAVSIPIWSPLFRLYLNEIQIQFRGDSSAMRCCSCIQHNKEHEDCQLAERIWCLYIFHVCGSQITLES
ncbi:uncharacterized protein [Euphorbia lathyris]|uniref:uncharacterized protein isoform X2 n=1 Tax=Euphorbia lathyris TaxID=212925 RepID=UPI00331357D9